MRVSNRIHYNPPPLFFVAYKKEDEEVLGIKKNEERNETDFRRVEMGFFFTGFDKVSNSIYWFVPSVTGFYWIG